MEQCTALLATYGRNAQLLDGLAASEQGCPGYRHPDLQLAQSVERFTIYTSPADEAIGLASTLFSSPRGRVGRYALDHVNDLTRSAMEYSNANFAVIDFSGAGDSQGDSYGHSYFRDAPTVSSDLVLMLRDDIDAGTPGRPLENVGLKFWRIPPGYPPRN